MMALHPVLARVTERIIERSRPSRRRYLDLMADQKERGISRPRLSCGNFAHGFAAAGDHGLDDTGVVRHGSDGHHPRRHVPRRHGP